MVNTRVLQAAGLFVGYDNQQHCLHALLLNLGSDFGASVMLLFCMPTQEQRREKGNGHSLSKVAYLSFYTFLDTNRWLTTQFVGNHCQLSHFSIFFGKRINTFKYLGRLANGASLLSAPFPQCFFLLCNLFVYLFPDICST